MGSGEQSTTKYGATYIPIEPEPCQERSEHGSIDWYLPVNKMYSRPGSCLVACEQRMLIVMLNMFRVEP